MPAPAIDHDRDPAHRPPTPRRRWLRRALVTLGILLVPLIIAWGYANRYLEHRLQDLVAKKLDAELRIERLAYIPPYGVWISGAHLVRKNNVVLNLGRLSLKLAESPFGGGPIVIEHLDVRNPVVRVIRTREGVQGGPGFVKDEVKQEPQPRKKFSDFLRLRKLRIHDGQIVYDDDTTRVARDVTWRNIDIDVDTAQKGPALYTFDVKFGNDPIASASVAGTIDVDELLMKLDRLSLGVKVDPKEEESPLPGEVQTILKDYAVAGRLNFQGAGTVPFKRMREATYDGTVELAGGTMRIPQWKAGIGDAAFKLRLAATQPTTRPATTQPALPGIQVAVEAFRLASDGASIDLAGGTLAIDANTRTWSLRELAGQVRADESGHANAAAAGAGAVREVIEKYKVAGAIAFTAAADGPLKPDANQRLDEAIRHEVLLYPRGVIVQPPTFPQPLRDLGGGVIRVANREVVIEDLNARYGDDEVMLNGARLQLADLPGQISVTELAGAINFHPPSPEYPRFLRTTVRALNPSGEFVFSGGYGFTREAEKGSRTDYDVMVSADAGAFTLTGKRIPITHISGDAHVRRAAGGKGAVDVTTFDGHALGGTVSAKAKFVTSDPETFTGNVSLRDVRLEEVTRYYEVPDKEKHKLIGRAFANVEASGELDDDTVLDTLRAKGRLEVFDGAFFEMPILGLVSRTVVGERPQRDIGTAGEAAVLFTVEDRTIRVTDAAVSAPLLGVQGGGTIGLDGALDIDLVAAPLADWRDKLKQTRVPIISDAAGELAGAVQRLINTATRGLLYEFRVSGTLKDPHVKTVPVPLLDEARAAVFGHMLGRPKGRPLIESLGGKRRASEEPASPPKK